MDGRRSVQSRVHGDDHGENLEPRDTGEAPNSWCRGSESATLRTDGRLPRPLQPSLKQRRSTASTETSAALKSRPHETTVDVGGDRKRLKTAAGSIPEAPMQTILGTLGASIPRHGSATAAVPEVPAATPCGTPRSANTRQSATPYASLLQTVSCGDATAGRLAASHQAGFRGGSVATLEPPQPHTNLLPVGGAPHQPPFPCGSAMLSTAAGPVIPAGASPLQPAAAAMVSPSTSASPTTRNSAAHGARNCPTKVSASGFSPALSISPAQPSAVAPRLPMPALSKPLLQRTLHPCASSGSAPPAAASGFASPPAVAGRAAGPMGPCAQAPKTSDLTPTPKRPSVQPAEARRSAPCRMEARRQEGRPGSAAPATGSPPSAPEAPAGTKRAPAPTGTPESWAPGHASQDAARALAAASARITGAALPLPSGPQGHPVGPPATPGEAPGTAPPGGAGSSSAAPPAAPSGRAMTGEGSRGGPEWGSRGAQPKLVRQPSVPFFHPSGVLSVHRAISYAPAAAGGAAGAAPNQTWDAAPPHSTPSVPGQASAGSFSPIVAAQAPQPSIRSSQGDSAGPAAAPEKPVEEFLARVAAVTASVPPPLPPSPFLLPSALALLPPLLHVSQLCSSLFPARCSECHCRGAAGAADAAAGGPARGPVAAMDAYAANLLGHIDLAPGKLPGQGVGWAAVEPAREEGKGGEGQQQQGGEDVGCSGAWASGEAVAGSVQRNPLRSGAPGHRGISPAAQQPPGSQVRWPQHVAVSPPVPRAVQSAGTVQACGPTNGQRRDRFDHFIPPTITVPSNPRLSPPPTFLAMSPHLPSPLSPSVVRPPLSHDIDPLATYISFSVAHMVAAVLAGPNVKKDL